MVEERVLFLLRGDHGLVFPDHGLVFAHEAARHRGIPTQPRCPATAGLRPATAGLTNWLEKACIALPPSSTRLRVSCGVRPRGCHGRHVPGNSHYPHRTAGICRRVPRARPFSSSSPTFIFRSIGSFVFGFAVSVINAGWLPLCAGPELT